MIPTAGRLAALRSSTFSVSTTQAAATDHQRIFAREITGLCGRCGSGCCGGVCDLSVRDRPPTARTADRSCADSRACYPGAVALAHRAAGILVARSRWPDALDSQLARQVHDREFLGDLVRPLPEGNPVAAADPEGKRWHPG